MPLAPTGASTSGASAFLLGRHAESITEGRRASPPIWGIFEANPMKRRCSKILLRHFSDIYVSQCLGESLKPNRASGCIGQSPSLI